MHPERNYLIHPTAVIMILIMTGLGVVFLSLSMAYVYVRADRGVAGLAIPWLFFLNTISLLVASLGIHRCTLAFGRRDERHLVQWGWLTLGVTLLFLSGQLTAWWQMLERQLGPESSPGTGYLYALSILHLLHVAAGIPFLLRVLVPVTRARAEGSMALLFLDDRLGRRIRHTAWYWHFLGVVWIYVMAFLLVNSLD